MTYIVDLGILAEVDRVYPDACRPDRLHTRFLPSQDKAAITSVQAEISARIATTQYPRDSRVILHVQ